MTMDREGHYLSHFSRIQLETVISIASELEVP